jgi:hypothetical protein
MNYLLTAAIILFGMSISSLAQQQIQISGPELNLTGLEKERDYLLFQRPLAESVYPNSSP